MRIKLYFTANFKIIRIVKLEDKCFISGEVSEDKIDSREEGDVFACQ